MILLFIPLLFVVVYLIYSFLSLKQPNQTVHAYVGGLGSGKTWMAVLKALSLYRSRYLLYRFKLIKDEPFLYSNFPIAINKKLNSRILQLGHMTGEIRLPEGAIVLIDEIGSIASQHNWDNPIAQLHMTKWIRFFRHWIGGHLIVTDQAPSEFLVGIRRRINLIYALENFRRFWIFFYRIDVRKLTQIEDITNISDTSFDSLPFFFGYLPFKLPILRMFNLTKPHYDTRCYSVGYKPTKPITTETWETMKTDYFIELPDSKLLRDTFKKVGYISLKEVDQLLKNNS